MNPVSHDILVAEDEPAAREFLARALQARGFRVVAAVGSGRAALAALARTNPEALFLDVRMPGGSGLEVARQVAGPDGPLCVFVTAHPSFAVPAFEVHAVDYLLKPFDDQRLTQCCGWLRQQLNTRRRGGAARLAASSTGASRLALWTGGSLRFVPFMDITHLTADGYCSYVSTVATTFHVRESLSALQQRLPNHFVRVHRSTIVHAAAVTTVVGAGHGDATVTLCDGTSLRVSRDRRDALTRVLTALSISPGPAASCAPGS